jgi:hypothetical protein
MFQWAPQLDDAELVLGRETEMEEEREKERGRT